MFRIDKRNFVTSNTQVGISVLNFYRSIKGEVIGGTKNSIAGNLSI